MKKAIMLLLTLALLFSLFSCVGSAVEFTGEDGKSYFYKYSDGIKSITNYNPYKFWDLPDYQELVQYGDGAGLENDGTVYFIYIVDTSIDPESAKAYYTAEFDGESKELLCDDGEYFSNEEKKIAVIERLLGEIDSTNFE